MLEKMLVSKKELSDINFERLKKALTYLKITYLILIIKYI